MERRTPLKLRSEFRAQAFEHATKLAELEAVYPVDEAAGRILRIARHRLMKCYGLKKSQKREQILEFIGDHARRIEDITETLSFPKTTVNRLLQDLIAAGEITKGKEKWPISKGRPATIYRRNKPLKTTDIKIEKDSAKT